MRMTFLVLVADIAGLEWLVRVMNILTTMINAVANKRRLNRNCELDLITIGKMPVRKSLYDERILQNDHKSLNLLIMAKIQFARGIDEAVVPDVRLTRAKTGESGTATFVFTNPQILAQDGKDEVTGMYLIDEEGEIVIKEVQGKFVNGKPESLEAIYVMKSNDEWDRFMRFMNRYAEDNGLGLSKS
jgi:photosystem II protein